MRSYKTFLAVFALFTALFSYTACSQRLIGNGNVVTQTRSIQPFSKLKLDAVFHVYLTQGETESVKVETDENLQDLIRIENDGDQLVVNMAKNSSFRRSTKMNVYITVKNLTEINSNMVGNLTTQCTLNLKNITLNLTSVGKSELAINCTSLSAVISSVGSTTLTGTAQDAVMTNSCVGQMDASGFVVDNLSFNYSGVGNAQVNAVNKLKLTSSGVGNIEYSGKPKETDINSSGVGKVRAR
jgi:Putative auto-transporter adhesin, head GIN domain